jgi:probable phosphoglycerate mutase
MSEPTTLLLIRHGETAWNRAKRIQGCTDIPLSPLGEAQAARLAERLVAGARRSERIDAVYSSTLVRAVCTATPIAGPLALQLQRRPGLCERNYGEFEGCDAPTILGRWPDQYAAWQRRDADFAPRGGESLATFCARVAGAMRAIVAAHPGGRVAVVAHGGVLDCFRRYATGMPLAQPRDFALLNASLNEAVWDAGAITLRTWADVTHLRGLAGDDDAPPPAAPSH